LIAPLDTAGSINSRLDDAADRMARPDAAADRDAHSPDVTARIGPNAITQLESVLRERLGTSQTTPIFAAAGLGHYLGRPPAGMVDEQEVARLHHQVRRALDAGTAEAVMTEAGDRTGRYILANRIPGPVVFALRHLPAVLCARLLMQAVRGHAWTFAGSGEFDIRHGPEGVIVARITANPVVALDTADTPICAWHAAVFARLFRALVRKTTTVTETSCCAGGDSACRFEIELTASAGAGDFAGDCNQSKSNRNPG